MSKVLGILCLGFAFPALCIESPVAWLLAMGLAFVGNDFLRHDEWEGGWD